MAEKNREVNRSNLLAYLVTTPALRRPAAAKVVVRHEAAFIIDNVSTHLDTISERTMSRDDSRVRRDTSRVRSGSEGE